MWRVDQNVSSTLTALPPSSAETSIALIHALACVAPTPTVRLQTTSHCVSATRATLVTPSSAAEDHHHHLNLWRLRTPATPTHVGPTVNLHALWVEGVSVTACQR